jgi:hypothetical protein
MFGSQSRRHRCTRREALCLPSGIPGGDPQGRNVNPIDLVRLGVLGLLRCFSWSGHLEQGGTVEICLR